MTYEQFKVRYPCSLNPQQEEAVRAVNGPVLLLAVPGSGKTTVLVTRLGYMTLGCGIPPESILTTTYTVAATGDMRRRFASLYGDELAKRMEFRTINGVSYRVIRRYEQLCGARAFPLCTDDKALSALVSGLYRQIWGDFPTEGEVKGLRTAFTYVKNQMLSQDALAEAFPEVENFPALYQAYNRALRERQLMDYDDQMVYALQILQKYPEILRGFQTQYPYVCVDEAQDTSKIQHRIIDLISAGSGNLFMVGDEDQSIYGFRAAYPQALMEFEQQHPGAKVLLMERNYRSTPQIVALADRFVQRNKDRRPKHMTAVRREGRPVRAIPVHDRRSQYAYLLRVAQDCRRETAVLFRDNDYALPVIDLLDRQGIPFRCRQLDGTFFTNRAVRDICDIIRLAMHPADGSLLLPLYYKFCAGIPKAAAESAARCCNEDCTAFDLLIQDATLSPWSRTQCKAIQTHLQNLLADRADKAIFRIVNFMGYGQYLAERNADTSRADILQALGAQEETPAQLLDRLETLKALVTSREPDGDSRCILSTIHASKGLEYDRVILMDVIDGLLPKENCILEEERRLFYVGLTRAKNELSVFTFQKPGVASSFAEELFPKKAPPERPKPKPLTWTAERAVPTDEFERQAARFQVGDAVTHIRFGSGVLVALEDDIASVRFPTGDVRRFILSAALQIGAIQRTEP